MVLVGICRPVLSLLLLQRTFEIGVHYKRKLLLPAVVSEGSPLVVFFGKNDGTIVHLPEVDNVGCQLLASPKIV